MRPIPFKPALYREVRIEAVRAIWKMVGTHEIEEDDPRILEMTDASGRRFVMKFPEAFGSGLPS